MESSEPSAVASPCADAIASTPPTVVAQMQETAVVDEPCAGLTSIQTAATPVSQPETLVPAAADAAPANQQTPATLAATQDASQGEEYTEGKNKDPNPPPPPPPPPSVQRRLFDFIRQRDPELKELSVEIKTNSKGGDIKSADAQNNAFGQPADDDSSLRYPAERKGREREVRERSEILRKMASCFSGCLTQSPRATLDDDEQYAPLFQPTDTEPDTVDSPLASTNYETAVDST